MHFSVANIYKEKSYIIGNKKSIDQNTESDTALSLYGILSTLKFSQLIHQKDYYFPVVNKVATFFSSKKIEMKNKINKNLDKNIQ